MIAVLAVYILCKGIHLLCGSSGVQGVLDGGTLQRSLEDAAVRTWAPGYAAAVEEQKTPDWMAVWLEQVAPVASYLAAGQAVETESDGGMKQASRASGGAVGRGEKEAGASVPGVDNDAPGQAEKEPDTSVPGVDNDASGRAEKKPDTPVTGADNDAPGQAESDADGWLDEAGSAVSGQAETGASGDTADQAEPAADETPDNTSEQTEMVRAAMSRTVSDELLAQLEDFDFLVSNYFTVDPGTTADSELLDIDTLLAEDLSIVQDPQSPQILIYHTHSQESFADSREGVTADTIVGMGDVLADELAAYGYNVIHDTGVYDLVDGELDRGAAYDYARDAVSRILEEHPTIEVVIDLHRDGVDGHKFVTEIDGRPTSMIMFFNGISRNNLDEPLYWLENPYIMQNLAFSMQLELKAREQYPGFTRNIYLKAERFNLHLRPRSLLIEAGTQLNTVEEEKNAMRPLANLLHQVLGGFAG